MSVNILAAVGASAGGVEALRALVGGLPRDFKGALCTVIHTRASGGAALAEVLSRAGALPASVAVDGEPIKPGRIYVAPGDYHLMVEERTLALVHGPRENGFRPAVDPLFRTAALRFRERAVGVVLSGALDDGANGLRMIRRTGGVAIAQDPDDALVGDMPRAAIEVAGADHILSAAKIGPRLAMLARRSTHPKAGRKRTSPGAAAFEAGASVPIEAMDGPPSPYTCPECGGSLWMTDEGLLPHYRCHVGHAFGSESLAEAQRMEIETALWVALRTLEETATLARGQAERASDRSLAALAEGYNQRAEAAESRAALIRSVLSADPVALPAPTLARDGREGKVSGNGAGAHTGRGHAGRKPRRRRPARGR